MEADLGQMFMENVVPQLIVAATAALGLFIAWAKSKTGQAIRNNVKNQAVQSALVWVNALVFDIVAHASQTTVKELKRALEDGKITEAEYKAGLAKIKAEVLAKLSAMTVGRLLGDGVVKTASEARELLEHKIEASVPITKAAQLAARNGGTAPANPQ